MPGDAFHSSGTSLAAHAHDVAQARRFEFGKNWQRFLRSLTAEQIAEARRSLVSMLGASSLAGKSFLDAGSGSGLFSLAARQLGARVVSFDFDPHSVACTRELKDRFAPDDAEWTILEGSVLDREFLARLATFDVVYSWGVLHHTGALWQALDNAAQRVAPGGQLFVAIYNHQPLLTPLHTLLKRAYVAAPRPLRPLVAAPQIAIRMAGAFAKDLALMKNPIDRYWGYARLRGMSWWHDMLDWIGGYPFETATPAAVCAALERHGFVRQQLVTCGRKSGCNQFVFRKSA